MRGQSPERAFMPRWVLERQRVRQVRERLLLRHRVLRRSHLRRRRVRHVRRMQHGGV
jgi:hypothetical protein